MSMLQIIFTIIIAGYLLERILDFLNARRWNETLPEEPARKSVNELEARLIVVETELAQVKESLEKLMKELLG